MVDFNEIWIINANGIALYHANEKNKKSVNKNLISGFLSAFQSMLKASKQGDVEAIKFKDSKLNIIAFDDPVELYFIARTDQRERDRSVRKHLNRCGKQFIEMFKDDIVNWDGNIDAFEKFTDELGSYFDRIVCE